ncbi:(2Fe-2S)-binding protein [Pseudonocardia sp. H11422]|uniref:(2Fe-2S)-binding protein n=1 Tax=Pseudonocardia sp. H11422 TaxID=2835866 RepID=UPI001BDD4680|nr:(2Fe-2S)-binding protein [Pseudonocardia sp. H11422]
MKVAFELNGEPVKVEVEPRTLLADAIRQETGLTGTHVGCEQGVCGSCTVDFDGTTVRSCLMFCVQAEGHQVRTVESLGTRPDDMHPVQQAFWDEHGLQCGFCTPGMLMVTKELLERSPDPTEEQIRAALAGNLCRCTGYVHIVKAVQAAAEKLRSGSL